MAKYFITWDLNALSETVMIYEAVEAEDITSALNEAYEALGKKNFTWKAFQAQVRYVTKIG